ncbi:MAG: glycosyltransferase family 2 protein [Acidimicrobiia bacterium]
MIGLVFWLCAALVAYTYVGYPLLALLLARLRRRPDPYPESTPSLTLFITAYNEEVVIAQKLEQSLALRYPPGRLQILVAADGSTDRTIEIVRLFVDRGIELSYQPRREGKMAAINRAMHRARGEIVVFSDANNHYEPDALRELVRPFADPTVGAVTGNKTVSDGDGPLSYSESLYWRYESMIREQESRLGCCTAVNGEIFAVRRALFEPAPTDIINDDAYITMRLIKKGHRVVYAPGARSWERVSVSAAAERERRSRIVAGQYQLFSRLHRVVPLDRPLVAWQIISHKLLRPLVPLAMVGALAANAAAVVFPSQPGGAALLRLATPFNWGLLAVQAAFYGFALLGERTTRLPTKVTYLPAFLVSSNAAAIRGLYRFLLGKQPPTWERVSRRDQPPQDAGVAS